MEIVPDNIDDTIDNAISIARTHYSRLSTSARPFQVEILEARDCVKIAFLIDIYIKKTRPSWIYVQSEKENTKFWLVVDVNRT